MKTSPYKVNKTEYSQNTTEQTLKNKSMINHVLPIPIPVYEPISSSTCLNHSHNHIHSHRHTHHNSKPNANANQTDQQRKLPHCTACPTPNIANTTWRIYTPETTAEPGGFRSNKKRITITPPCVLKREYYIQKKANNEQERLFAKKKLRGRLFHLLRNNFIMDSTSYHIMNLNTKEPENESRSNTKETLHGNEYRKKHQIGIVTKKSSDAFNTIPITRRYEDNYYTPQEFVTSKFTQNEISLFENDPIYFNLGNTPINRSSLLFTRHLKDKLAAEENKSNGNNTMTTIRQHNKDNETRQKKEYKRPYTHDPIRKQRSKVMFKINKALAKSYKVNPIMNHYHPVILDEYINKLNIQREDLFKKQSMYQERRNEIEDIKSIKIERKKQNRIKRRNKQLQIANKLKKEHDSITTLVTILRNNYQKNTGNNNKVK